MKKLLLLLCAVLIFSFCACGTNSDTATQKQPEWLLGETEGNTYTNNVVGFSAAIPEGWEAANLRQMSSLSGIPETSLSQITGLEPDSQMLIFFCTKYGYTHAGENPCIGITVSNQAALKPLVTDKQALNDYVEKNRSSLEQQYGDSGADLSSETGVKSGDNEYSVIHINAEFNETRLIQDIYILGIRDYVLMITETYSDVSDKEAADTFLENLKIK